MRLSTAIRHFLFSVAAYLCAATEANGQLYKWLEVENDTTYIQDFSRDLTARVNVSTKLASFRMINSKTEEEVIYRPNNALNLGIGLNYKFVGFNIGYNLPNADDADKYGSSKALDLSFHVYLRKLILDVYHQSYKGFYLANTGALTSLPPSGNYLRPDINAHVTGFSLNYIFSPSKYSFRAAYLQNEYQKKSAGSLLLGLEVYKNSAQGDSSLIPKMLAYSNFYEGSSPYGTNSFSASLSGGYAYTLVLKKHLFLLINLQAGAGIEHARTLQPKPAPKRETTGLAYHTTIRLATGYNSAKYFVGLQYLGISLYGDVPYQNSRQSFGTDNLRLSIARRFHVKKPLIGNF